jgi:hypothetical protein
MFLMKDDSPEGGIGAVVYLQVSPLGDSHGETWRGQGIRNCSVSWNLPKLIQLWWCNLGFGPSTTQNHLWTEQSVGGMRIWSGVGASVLWKEGAGLGLGPRLSSMLPGALRSQVIAPAVWLLRVLNPQDHNLSAFPAVARGRQVWWDGATSCMWWDDLSQGSVGTRPCFA